MANIAEFEYTMAVFTTAETLNQDWCTSRKKYILVQPEIIGPKRRRSQMKSMPCNT